MLARHFFISCVLLQDPCDSVWSDLLVLHNYCVIISECQKVTFLGVELNKFWSQNGKTKVARNCLKWREN